MPKLPALRLTGAKILRDDTLNEGTLSLYSGNICEGNFPEVDLRGYLVLPGIVDLHGDGFERHLQPRPNVHFDKMTGLKNTDAELAANGVTTAILAQCWSWLGGRRSPEYATDLLKNWAAYKHKSLVDMRIQLRYETHMVDTVDAMLLAIKAHNVEYLVYNNHINDASNAQASAPLGFAGYAAEAGRTVKQHSAILEEMLGNAMQVDNSLKRLAPALSALKLRTGSHDDDSASKRQYFADLGADICEFPTTRKAAEHAHNLANPILMGAPNVVRGGSQSGNISAQSLIEDGLCDALVSDYYYPALQAAAWALADKGVLPFGKAWALISSNPAAILGLSDRGTLAEGMRADLLVINEQTKRIEATISNGRIAALSGEAGVRFMRALTAQAVAAA